MNIPIPSLTLANTSTTRDLGPSHVQSPQAQIKDLLSRTVPWVGARGHGEPFVALRSSIFYLCLARGGEQPIE